MIRTLRAFFLARLLREKVLLAGIRGPGGRRLDLEPTRGGRAAWCARCAPRPQASTSSSSGSPTARRSRPPPRRPRASWTPSAHSTRPAPGRGHGDRERRGPEEQDERRVEGREQRPVLGAHAPVQRDQGGLGDAQAVLPGAQQALPLHRDRAVLRPGGPGEPDAPERQLPDLLGRDPRKTEAGPPAARPLQPMAIVSSRNGRRSRPLASLGAVLPLRRLSFRAMATLCEVQYTAPGGDAQATAFEAAAGDGSMRSRPSTPVSSREHREPDQRRRRQGVGPSTPRPRPSSRSATRSIS